MAKLEGVIMKMKRTQGKAMAWEKMKAVIIAMTMKENMTIMMMRRRRRRRRRLRLMARDKLKRKIPWDKAMDLGNQEAGLITMTMKENMRRRRAGDQLKTMSMKIRMTCGKPKMMTRMMMMMAGNKLKMRMAWDKATDLGNQEAGVITMTTKLMRMTSKMTT
jgi:ribosomal protein L32